MGFFDDIKAKVFGAPVNAAIPAASATPAPSAEVQAAQQAALAAGKAAADKAIAAALAANAAAAGQPATIRVADASGSTTVPSAATVDVAAILDAAVAKSGQKLNWKTSIVDLLKALDIDSSITARKALADELGYTGDKSDSATMNIWLHKQVLSQLAANGGKVPDSLLA